eukprot:scaffold1669_cov108-Isochrysis_galbana.AAC.6
MPQRFQCSLARALPPRAARAAERDVHAQPAMHARAIQAHEGAKCDRRPRRILSRAVEARLRAAARTGHAVRRRGRNYDAQGRWPASTCLVQRSSTTGLQHSWRVLQTRSLALRFMALKISSRIACGTSLSGSGLPRPSEIIAATEAIAGSRRQAEGRAPSGGRTRARFGERLFLEGSLG